MNRRLTVALFGALILLAPTTVYANGFNYLEGSMRWTAVGAVIGCLVGLLVATANRARPVGLTVWIASTGMAVGLVFAAFYVLQNYPFFFPHNVGCLPVLVLVAVAVVLVFCAVVWIVRGAAGRTGDRRDPPDPDR